MITALAATALLLGQGTPSIDDVVQKNFKDAAFKVQVTYANQKELAKINKDFGQSYRFKTMDVKLKEPFMVRLTGTVEDTNVLFILNGEERIFSVPKIKLRQKENLDDEPGKRQTPMDFGFLTPSMFKGLFQAKFNRVDRATGDWVFDITYHPKYEYRSWNRVWVDPQKKVITKREWYRRDRQLATFFYSEPKQEGGVWLPTKLRVKNVEDKVAGETSYADMEINKGLSADLFKI